MGGTGVSRCIDSQAFAPDTTSRGVSTPCTHDERVFLPSRHQTNPAPVGYAVRSFRAPDTHKQRDARCTPFHVPMTDKSVRAERQESESAAPPAGAGADIIYLPDGRQRTKKVTSGSENRQRKCGVFVRLLPADLERLKPEAAATNMSVAGYLASGRLGKEATYRPRIGQRRRTADIVALTDALVALNRAGNNQNQIARALNELLLIAHEHSNAWLASEVAALAEAIRGLPMMFAEPVAAIMAALNRGGSDDP